MEGPLLFLNPIATLGGGERSLLNLLAQVRDLRAAWPIRLLLGAHGPLTEEASRLGVAVEVLPMPERLVSFGESGFGLAGGSRIRRSTELLLRALAATNEARRYLGQLRRSLAEIRPRLVHSNGLKYHLLSGYAVPKGTPVVWHIHDFLTPRPILGRTLRRLAVKPSLAVANSHATAADFQVAIPGPRVETIYNGIDVAQFCPGPGDPQMLDRLAGLPPAPAETVRVGLVATYARWKGQDVFLQAAGRLAVRTKVPVRFYIVGGPVYQTSGSQYAEAELLDFIKAERLEGNAGLVPFCRDLPPIYRSLDIMVHASTRPEPFGMTIVEAMACGRAVIVAKAGGAAELFVEGESAVGVTPNDPAALTAALDRLVAEPAQRALLGQGARRHATLHFSRVQMGERFVAAYESLVLR